MGRGTSAVSGLCSTGSFDKARGLSVGAVSIIWLREPVQANAADALHADFLIGVMQRGISRYLFIGIMQRGISRYLLIGVMQPIQQRISRYLLIGVMQWGISRYLLIDVKKQGISRYLLIGGWQWD